ncbi:MAG TPA: SDR family oxidoreductase [Candidatus Saccharimonadales bacterium]|nr:SDR family oxidoreductase [Candidatus Saccharimonadales bacterium]
MTDTRKIVVVTGASKGIGKATAISFARIGYDVVVNYLNDENSANEVINLIEAEGRKAIAIKSDVFKESGVKKLFEGVKASFGRIDVLVNNAGYPKEPSFGDWTEEAIIKSFAGNVGSAALCAQYAVPLMSNGGSILFNSSIYGLQFGGNPHLTLYSAGKAAIINLSQAMAEKLAPNIRCNAVAPGMTKTPAWDDANPEYVTTGLGMTLQKEWVEPEEIAAAFVFLAETPHINAQTIVVDGGWQKKIRANVIRH